jgi:hypothetical protein
MSIKLRIISLVLLPVLVAEASGGVTRRQQDISTCESVHADRAVSAVRADGKLPAEEFLRAIRAGIYDEPFQATWHEPAGLEAYLVRDSGVETTGDGRTVFHSSSGFHEVLVYVLPKTNKVYLLRGSREPLSGFNELVQTLGFKCGSGDTALQLSWAYLDIASGSAEQVVQSGQEARWAVEGYRLRQSGEAGVSVAIADWWAANERKLAQIKPPSAAEGKDAYSVVFYLARAGGIVRQKLDIKKSCAVQAAELEVITTELGTSYPKSGDAMGSTGCSCPPNLMAENRRKFDAIGAAGRARAGVRGANRGRRVLGGRELHLEQTELERGKRDAQMRTGCSCPPNLNGRESTQVGRDRSRWESPCWSP